MERRKNTRSEELRAGARHNRIAYDDVVQDYVPQLTPEQKLLYAVLFNAIRDMKLSDRAPDKRTARVWFNSHKTGPFSFLWISELLDFDADKFRTRVLELSSDELRALISEQRTRVFYEQIKFGRRADICPFIM